MSMKKLLLLNLIILLSASHANAMEISAAVHEAMKGNHRETANVSRDQFRHPADTLEFFGLKPDMTIVEIWPGGGWYTEILAAVTRGQGVYYAAGFAMTADRTPNWRKGVQKDLMEKIEKRPDVYDHIVSTELDVPERVTIAPPGTVDMVLTFRNVHNWLKGDYAEEMFKVMARALKPGGILGLVEHRAKPGTPVAKMKKSGYMTEDYVIKLAENAGFVLEEKSEINANEKDSSSHPAGVWSLLPSLRYCKKIEADAEREECIEKYTPIGESDRMTLRFRKAS